MSEWVVLGVEQPNPIKVFIEVLRVIFGTKSPSPQGSGVVDHARFQPVLDALASRGLPGVIELSSELGDYVSNLENVDPDALSRDEALAYWINLYNAGAIQLAMEAFEVGAVSVLRIDGAFGRPIVTVAGERLSLAAIEHAKIRRFKDPRIHAALVCGSLSCPTLRGTPFTGDDLAVQLDDQMAAFVRSGAVVRGEEGSVELSQIFRWYGADFTQPGWMPWFRPTSKRATLKAIERWVPSDLRSAKKIRFQEYDWGLACNVA